VSPGEPWVSALPGGLARSLQDDVVRNSGLDAPSPGVLTVSLLFFGRLIEPGRWLGLVPASSLCFSAKRLRIKLLPVQTLSPLAPVGLITVKIGR
jgi:hypothetical protein